MTGQPPLDPPPVVLDTTCLSHFSRADRIDVLGDLLISRTVMTTDVVRDEIQTGAKIHSELDAVLGVEWLHVHVRVGRRYHLSLHGTLWLLGEACQNGKLTSSGPAA